MINLSKPIILKFNYQRSSRIALRLHKMRHEGANFSVEDLFGQSFGIRGAKRLQLWEDVGLVDFLFELNFENGVGGGLQ